jgi:CHAT domain
MTYDDFELRIDADGEGFRVRARAPRGATSHPLLLADELAASRPDLPKPSDGGSAAQARDTQQAAAPLAARRSSRHTGSLLFSALFAGPVRSLFDSSLGEAAAAEPRRGLLVRLRFDLQDSRVRPLFDLPWELLCRDETGEYLGLHRSTPIVRCLDTPLPSRPLKLTSPLRVLLAMADPSTGPRLDLAGERRQIEQALGGSAQVQVVALEHATRDALVHSLREQSFHIVHFMGHGSFDQASGAGALILESPAGAADPMAAATLADLFSDREHPILVILNTCHSASSTATASLDPFAGVAAALVLAGLPAVLAMRTAILDRAAIRLTAELYRHLARGDRLEAAVSEVRLALRTAYEDSAEWSIPALFLREGSAAVEDGTVAVGHQAEAATRRSEGRGIAIHHEGDIGKQTIIDGNVGTLNVN